MLAEQCTLSTFFLVSLSSPPKAKQHESPSMHLFRVCHGIMRIFRVCYTFSLILKCRQCNKRSRLYPLKLKPRLSLWKTEDRQLSSNLIWISDEWIRDRVRGRRWNVNRANCSIISRPLPLPSAWQHCCTLSLCDFARPHVWTSESIKSLILHYVWYHT